MRTVIYGMHLNPILPLEIFFDQLQEGFLHESRKISNSYLEELDELAIKKRKVEDDLNDIYHERKKLMIEKECDDWN